MFEMNDLGVVIAAVSPIYKIIKFHKGGKENFDNVIQSRN